MQETNFHVEFRLFTGFPVDSSIHSTIKALGHITSYSFIYSIYHLPLSGNLAIYSVFEANQKCIPAEYK